MPNWTKQQLHVIGKKADIDRFMRVGYTRSHRGEPDDILHFDVICPPKLSPEDRGHEIESGVVLTHWRTNNQACFSLITAWDYPADFYAAIATEWPTLSYCCSVNGEMGDFGGLLMCLDGEFVNQVCDFDGTYDRRAHMRAARASLKRWMAFLTHDRGWRVMPHRAWQEGAMRADAHFDGDFWFYFRSPEAMATFRERYRCHHAQRRADGAWKRTR